MEYREGIYELSETVVYKATLVAGSYEEAEKIFKAMIDDKVDKDTSYENKVKDVQSFTCESETKIDVFKSSSEDDENSRNASLEEE